MSRSTTRQGHKSRWKARDAKFREEHQQRRRQKRDALAKHTVAHPNDLSAWDCFTYLQGSREAYSKALAEYMATNAPEEVDPPSATERAFLGSAEKFKENMKAVGEAAEKTAEIFDRFSLDRPTDNAVWDEDLGCWVEEIELSSSPQLTGETDS